MRQQTTPQAFLSRTFFPWNYTLIAILLFFFPRSPFHCSHSTPSPFFFILPFFFLFSFFSFLLSFYLHPIFPPPPLSLTSSPRKPRAVLRFGRAPPTHIIYMPRWNFTAGKYGSDTERGEGGASSTLNQNEIPGRIYTRNTERGCGGERVPSKSVTRHRIPARVATGKYYAVGWEGRPGQRWEIA